jgi:hypothetical protein
VDPILHLSGAIMSFLDIKGHYLFEMKESNDSPRSKAEAFVPGLARKYETFSAFF